MPSDWRGHSNSPLSPCSREEGWCGCSVLPRGPPPCRGEGAAGSGSGEEALQEPCGGSERALRRTISLPCWLEAPAPSHLFFRLNQLQVLLRWGWPAQLRSCCSLAPAQLDMVEGYLGSPGARALQLRSGSPQWHLARDILELAVLSKGWGCLGKSQAFLQTVMPSAPKPL